MIAFVAASTASADPPDQTSVYVDSTRALPAAETGCGFDIVRHSQGTLYQTTFYDSQGNVTRTVLLVSSYKITDTNPVSGKSITSVLGGPVIITQNGDGTVTVTIPGNDGHLTAPGEGVVWSNTGRLSFIADASDPFTPLTILSVHGSYTTLGPPYPDACGALT